MYWGHMEIMEEKMETTIVYGGYIGIMKKKTEATIVRIIICEGPCLQPTCMSMQIRSLHFNRYLAMPGSPAAVSDILIPSYPYRTPIYYSSFHFLFRHPHITLNPKQ